jgi:hypothetical protein
MRAARTRKGTGGERARACARRRRGGQDAFDRPVANATIGVHDVGICGHMPDQRAAVTDADGVAVLHGLGFTGGEVDSRSWEAWVQGRGLLGDYHDRRAALPRRQILRHGPLPPWKGRSRRGRESPLRAHTSAPTTARARGRDRRRRLVPARRSPTRESITVRIPESRGQRATRVPVVHGAPAGRSARLPSRAEGRARGPSPSTRSRSCSWTRPRRRSRRTSVRDRRAGRDGASRSRSAFPAGSWTLRLGGGERSGRATARLVVKDEA